MKADLYLDTLTTPTPQDKDLKPFVDLIFTAGQEIQKRFNGPPYINNQEAAEILYWSFIHSPTDLWVRRFIDARSKAFRFWINPRICWKAIATVLYSPLIQNQIKQLIPSFNPENYQLKTAAPPAPQKIAPQPRPKTKPPPAHPREETIIQFITNHAPSINYLHGFIFISRHTKNRFSCRGRKVYPYGQHYVARKLEISLRTVNEIFSWLRSHHIIFKRSNENYDRHKSATWFVCTSWIQSTYFLDPQGRRPKKGSPRSRRKRRSAPLHT